MTIEATLERIAAALEKLGAGAMIDAAVEASLPPPTPAKPSPERKTRTVRGLEPTPIEEVSTGQQADWVDEPAEETEEKTYTINDVRAALVEYQGKHGQEKARALLKKEGGTETLGMLSPEKFAAVVAAATK